MLQPPKKNKKTGKDAVKALWEYYSNFGMEDKDKDFLKNNISHQLNDGKKAIKNLGEFFSDPFVDPYNNRNKPYKLKEEVDLENKITNINNLTNDAFNSVKNTGKKVYNNVNNSKISKGVKKGLQGMYQDIIIDNKGISDLYEDFKKDYKNNNLFAFGGTAMNVATPSEELAKAQRVSQQAHFGAMSDPTVAGLKGIGNMFINTGMSMASKGYANGAGGDSGMGKFLKNNMGSINSIVGLGQSATMRASGGKIGDPTLRPDGTKKGKGFYGPLKTSTGNDMTEYSIGVEWDGVEHLLPTIVPGLGMRDRDYLLLNDGFGKDEEINKRITDNAIKYAQLRQKGGQPFFATEKEESKLKFALGGTTGKSSINAEGGEIVDTPNGVPVELNGPSHASGGIDLEVPQGTEIYSKRLKGEDGKSMADRKKKREKEILKVQKLLEKDPTNNTLKKTLAKIKSNNDFIDEKDLSQMQFVKDLVDHTNKFALGGYVDEESPMPIFNNKYKDLLGLFSKGLPTDVGTTYYPDPMVENMLKDKNTQDLQSLNNAQPEVYAPASTDPEGKYGNTTSAKTGDAKNFSLNDYLGGATFGDMLGMGANLFGANAQMKNTLANRNATPLEQNAFKNFGDQALKKIQSQYGLLDDVRDNQLQNAELSRQGTIARNNNSARGINTQRALNLATDSSMNELKANIFAQYAQQAMGISAQEAVQMAQNDQMRMRGEDRRAERELQNTDNFFSNMAKNISDKYRGIGETGKSLNKIKEREVTQKNIEEQLELLKKGTDGELTLDKVIAARYGITVEELRNLKNQKNKKG